MQQFIINTIFTRAASTVLNFMVALLIARHSGPAVKGEVTLLITTMWFFIFFSSILGGQVLVYLVPRSKTELLVIPAYIWSILISAAGFFFLKTTHLVHASHITSVAVLSLLSSLISIHQIVLLARKQISNANILHLIPILLQVAGILFCFYILRISNAYAFIYASVFAYSIGLIASFVLVKPFIRFGSFGSNFNMATLGASFRYGLLFQVIEILQLFSLRYYFYQLGIQQGVQYLGIYSIGISILEAVWIIPRSMATVHYVSTANSAEVQQEIERTVMLTKTTLVLCTLALLLLWLVPPQVYTFIFGPGFSDVKHSIRYLYPGILIYAIPIVITSFYMGIGKYRPLIIANLTGAVAMVVFSALLIPPYVMSGAGLAATLSFSLVSLTLLIYFLMEYHISIKRFGLTRDDMKYLVEKVTLILTRVLIKKQ